ncbi:hypothetical protein [Sphingomonas mollis]|uniref:Sulfur globule protein n=1 Tax=Sphingomonas mollis TaxID=2795726 RepID=A0ABS0XSW9_9SPHN|nr:hypothetical protein [Sphingomonas sp. BT553]MBJ6123160.1 hypothetical protein [Sphingomonas sp. BT553]
MKIVALIGAGLLASGTFVAASADAQPRHGYGRGYDRGYGHDRGWRGDRWDRGQRWNGGYRRDRGRWNGGYRGRGRGRLVCHMERGRYGPVRTCFRGYR